jgi:hypothetical protein
VGHGEGPAEEVEGLPGDAGRGGDGHGDRAGGVSRAGAEGVDSVGRDQLQDGLEGPRVHAALRLGDGAHEAAQLAHEARDGGLGRVEGDGLLPVADGYDPAHVNVAQDVVLVHALAVVVNQDGRVGDAGEDEPAGLEGVAVHDAALALRAMGWGVGSGEGAEAVRGVIVLARAAGALSRVADTGRVRPAGPPSQVRDGRAVPPQPARARAGRSKSLSLVEPGPKISTTTNLLEQPPPRQHRREHGLALAEVLIHDPDGVVVRSLAPRLRLGGGHFFFFF